MTSQNTSSKSLIKRLLNEFISKYYKELLLSIFCMTIVAITTALNAWMMKPILDRIFTEQNREMLIIIPIIILIVSIIRGGATYSQHVLTRMVENKILIDVQLKLFNKLLYSDISFMNEHSSGRLISHFTNDINTMRHSISNVLTNIVREFLTLILLLIMIFYYIPTLAMITFCVFPIAIYPVYLLGKKMRIISKKTQHELSTFTKQLDETFQGIRVVKACNAEKIERKRTKNITNNLLNLYKKSIRTDSLTSPLMETVGGISLAIIIAFGGMQVIEGKISTGTFFMFITAILSAYKPMKSLTKLNNTLQLGLAATARIFTLLDNQSKILENKSSTYKITKGDINLIDVTFSYPNSNKTAIQNLNLHIPQGRKVALVGHSGSGKSTIMNLIIRFYDPNEGEIIIDGHSIKDYSFSNLRSAIAYVSQDVFLFDDTIYENIRYGIDKNISKQKVIDAAKAALADDFIIELEDGYETLIGQKGTKLSGGQKQRISIARAILRNTPILLLDEATSALDPISEQKVKIALDKLQENKTSLIIAHRAETIKNADLVYVMQNGIIIASGTHQNLLDNNSYYAKLFKQKEFHSN